METAKTKIWRRRRIARPEHFWISSCACRVGCPPRQQLQAVDGAAETLMGFRSRTKASRHRAAVAHVIDSSTRSFKDGAAKPIFAHGRTMMADKSRSHGVAARSGGRQVRDLWREPWSAERKGGVLGFTTALERAANRASGVTSKPPIPDG